VDGSLISRGLVAWHRPCHNLTVKVTLLFASRKPVRKRRVILVLIPLSFRHDDC
jgi:hypothetical protein